MKKQILTTINLVLSAILVMLTGCKTQQKAAETNSSSLRPDREPQTIGRPAETVVCMYGIPPALREYKDTIPSQNPETLEPDTTDVK